MVNFFIRAGNSYANIFENLLLGPMQFPKLEAVANLYFCALNLRFTHICVQNPICQLRTQIHEDAFKPKL